jgi:hypothetical protein
LGCNGNFNGVGGSLWVTHKEEESSVTLSRRLVPSVPVTPR